MTGIEEVQVTMQNKRSRRQQNRIPLFQDHHKIFLHHANSITTQHTSQFELWTQTQSF